MCRQRCIMAIGQRWTWVPIYSNPTQPKTSPTLTQPKLPNPESNGVGMFLLLSITSPNIDHLFKCLTYSVSRKRNCYLSVCKQKFDLQDCGYINCVRSCVFIYLFIYIKSYTKYRKKEKVTQFRQNRAQHRCHNC